MSFGIFYKMVNKYRYHVPIWAGLIGFSLLGTIRGISLILTDQWQPSEVSSTLTHVIIVYGIVWTLTCILVSVGTLRRNRTTIPSAMSAIMVFFIESFIFVVILIYGTKRCKELKNHDLINHCEIAFETMLAFVVFHAFLLFHNFYLLNLLSLYHMIRDGTRNQEIYAYWFDQIKPKSMYLSNQECSLYENNAHYRTLTWNCTKTIFHQILNYQDNWPDYDK